MAMLSATDDKILFSKLFTFSWAKIIEFREL
jgi:hypothetical protein